MVESRSRSDELDDATAGYDWAHLDLRRLLKPDVIRRTIGVFGGLMVVFWPRRTDEVLGVLVGIGIMGYIIVTLWSVVRHRSASLVVVASSSRRRRTRCPQRCRPSWVGTSMSTCGSGSRPERSPAIDDWFPVRSR